MQGYTQRKTPNGYLRYYRHGRNVPKKDVPLEVLEFFNKPSRNTKYDEPEIVGPKNEPGVLYSSPVYKGYEFIYNKYAEKQYYYKGKKVSKIPSNVQEKLDEVDGDLDFFELVDRRVGSRRGGVIWCETARVDTERSDTTTRDTERSDTERSDTERSDTERSDTERSDTLGYEDRTYEFYYIYKNWEIPGDRIPRRLLSKVRPLDGDDTEDYLQWKEAVKARKKVEIEAFRQEQLEKARETLNERLAKEKAKKEQAKVGTAFETEQERLRQEWAQFIEAQQKKEQQEAERKERQEAERKAKEDLLQEQNIHSRKDWYVWLRNNHPDRNNGDGSSLVGAVNDAVEMLL